MAEEPKRENQEAGQQVPRLLPWTEDGKTCWLVPGGAGSFLSGVADAMEAEQVRTAREVLAQSRGLLETEGLGAHELRFIACRLAEGLADTLRIAESRGMRLGAEGPVKDASAVELVDVDEEG